MQLKILNISGTEIGKKNLPTQFDEPIRPDIIQRAVLAIQSHLRQPYGAFPMAGKQASVPISKRRRNFRGTYGKGQSRIPRKALSRNGSQFNLVGAFMPGTVKGRQAHPPKAGKIWAHKINEQERHKAIRSALAATIVASIVQKRGHQVPKGYPFLVENKFETLPSTQEAVQTLHKLGLTPELERCGERRIRAGKGKLRGRRHKTKKGPLLVVQKNSQLLKTARNIPGVDVVEVQNLNAYLLAPGAHYGRLTIFTEAAVEMLAQNKLFTRDALRPAVPEKKEPEKKILVKKETHKKETPKVADKKTLVKKEDKKEAKKEAKK